MLGHHEPRHHAIVLSSVMDWPEVPRLAAEYVMFHEMFHLRQPVELKRACGDAFTRRSSWRRKEFPRLKEARELLKHL